MGYADDNVHASGEVSVELDREKEHAQRYIPACKCLVVGIDHVDDHSGAFCDDELFEEAVSYSYRTVSDA